MVNLEYTLIKKEVEGALLYSLNSLGNISKDKLKEYQREWAEDSRYSFKIWDLLDKLDLVLVEYKKEKFICKYNRIKSFFIVENINSS